MNVPKEHFPVTWKSIKLMCSIQQPMELWQTCKMATWDQRSPLDSHLFVHREHAYFRAAWHNSKKYQIYRFVVCICLIGRILAVLPSVLISRIQFYPCLRYDCIKQFGEGYILVSWRWRYTLGAWLLESGGSILTSTSYQSFSYCTYLSFVKECSSFASSSSLPTGIILSRLITKNFPLSWRLASLSLISSAVVQLQLLKLLSSITTTTSCCRYEVPMVNVLIRKEQQEKNVVKFSKNFLLHGNDLL